MGRLTQRLTGRWRTAVAGSVGRVAAWQDRRLRALYPEGVATLSARRQARFWSRAIALGIVPRRWVSLEVTGRRSGRVTRFPLGMADVGGQWYLVSMLGECNWVRNVRAAGGRAVLRRRRRRPVLLVEVPVGDRAPILKRYVEKVPGGRPHIPVNRRAPVEAFREVAADLPVFWVRPATSGGLRWSTTTMSPPDAPASP